MEEQEKKRILLVEDDPNFGLVLESYLKIKQFDVTLCDDGNKAVTIAKSHNFDLVILDVMLPNKDGFTIAKELNASGYKRPFIFLTARALKEDKIKGFQLGALDYLVKPFDPEILYLKISAFLYQQEKVIPESFATSEYQIGSFTLNTINQSLTFKEEQINLTHKEAELLRMLIQNKNQILLRSNALETIWETDNYYTTKSMDVYITKLRKHLKQDPNFTIKIQNVHGKGFRLLIKNEN